MSLALSVTAFLTLVVISLPKSADKSPNGFQLRPRCAEPNEVVGFQEVAAVSLISSALGSPRRMRLQMLRTHSETNNSALLVFHCELGGVTFAFAFVDAVVLLL